MNTCIQNIIQQLEILQDGKPWIGSTYSKKLQQVYEEDFFIRPVEGLLSIAEIISHLTLWRKEAILKIETGTGSKTDDCEENWLSNDKLKALGWETIIANYNATTTDLITLLNVKTDDFLHQKYYDTDFKGEYTYNWLLNGMIQHDAYHLGQLGTIIKFLKMKR